MSYTIDPSKATMYGNALTYGTTSCDGYIYGVAGSVSGDVGGSITDIVEFSGSVVLTSNITIESGSAVIIACDASVNSNKFAVSVDDGGYMNTRGQRLPSASKIANILVIT